MRNVVGIIALTFFSIIAEAEVHRWVDASGKIHYSDLEPLGRVHDEKTLRSPASAASTSDASRASPAKTLADKEMEFRKRRIEAEEARLKQEKDRTAQLSAERNCASARSNLKNLQEGGRIVRYDEKGERSFLDDNERNRRAAEAQKAVSDWCGEKR